MGPGDWNAFFGFGTNILVNLLTLTGLLRFVLKMPDELVFGRILPATGLMLCLSTLYYAWLAYQLAKKTGRTDVCALPSGIVCRETRLWDGFFDKRAVWRSRRRCPGLPGLRSGRALASTAR